MTAQKKRIATRVVGVSVSVGSGAYYGSLMPIPFGLSETYFHALAPVAGYLGYEFGRWLGTLGYKPVILIALAVIIAPCAIYVYDALLHLGYPSALNNLFIFLSYTVGIFVIGAAVGSIGLKVENLTDTQS